MTMTFNGVLFQDLKMYLKRLSELLSIPAKAKDPNVSLMQQEARIHAFMACHYVLNSLLKDIYDQSDMSKKEGANPQNAPGEVLMWLLNQKLLSTEHVKAIAQQYEAVGVLSFDSSWLLHEDKKVYRKMLDTIPRYHYGMHTFVVHLAKNIVFYREKQ